ncbi:MAG: transposase family protein [Segetibacter sp.]|nr:transposase family protein [Segetibacter sp.]
METLIKGFAQPQAEKPIVVFFEDEARFGRISKELACWVKKAVVPTVAKQMIREYIYAYSALCPQTGDCFSFISPLCNTGAMTLFLQQLSQQYSKYRIVMLLDKAGWHVSKNLELPENVKLMHLTPYSPELNPVELLWREIRAKYFKNRIFETLDAVEDTLVTALGYYHNNKHTVLSLSKGFFTF